MVHLQLEEKVIIGLSDQNEECRKQGYKNWIQWRIFMLGHKHLRPRWEEPNGELYAAISKGRWYVKCGGKICGVSQGIDENEPLFFCIDCLNVENEHRPQRVIWENVKDLHLLMGVRKAFQQRNFEPHLGETHDHLRLENERLINGIYYT